MQLTKKIDLTLLPEEARKELIDFYEFLLQKYGTKKQKCKKLPKGFYSPIKIISYLHVAKREDIYER